MCLMEQELIMSVGQEQDNMTHKEYLLKVKTIEFKVHGDVDKEEALAALEKERMEDLENHLDIDFIKAMDDDGSYDEGLENEYGNLF